MEPQQAGHARSFVVMVATLRAEEALKRDL